MNFIAKLLMNSLYGKFGMKNIGTTVELYNMDNKQHELKLANDMEVYGELFEDVCTII